MVIEALVVHFLLVTVRVGGFTAALPVFGDRSVPRTVRIGLTLALAAMWVADPHISTHGVAAQSTVLVGTAVIREALLGLFLGFTFSLFLLPIRIAGNYIGQEMGLTLSAITSPDGQDSASILSEIFLAIGTMLFLTMNLHHTLLALLEQSFARWPVGSALPAESMASAWRSLNMAHHHGFLIAAPIGIWLFITTIALLLLGKASPHLNLMSVGLTVRVFGGVVACVVFLPEVMSLMRQSMHQVQFFVSRSLF